MSLTNEQISKAFTIIVNTLVLVGVTTVIVAASVVLLGVMSLGALLGLFVGHPWSGAIVIPGIFVFTFLAVKAQLLIAEGKWRTVAGSPFKLLWVIWEFREVMRDLGEAIWNLKRALRW